MTRWYRLIRKSRAQYSTVETAVRERLIEVATSQGIDVDADELTGEQTNRLFNVEYDWEIQPAEGYYILFEKQYISTSWLILFFLLLLIPIGLITVPRPWYPHFGVAVVIVGASVILPFFYRTPVEETVFLNEKYRSVPSAMVMLPLTGILILITIILGWFTFTSSFDLFPLFFLAVILVYLVYVMFQRQSSIVNFQPENAPHYYEFIARYLTLFCFSLLPAAALIAVQSYLLSSPVLGHLSYLPIGLLSLVVLGGMAQFILRDSPLVYADFLEGADIISVPLHRILVLLGLAMGTYATLGILFQVIRVYADVLTFENPIIIGVVAITAVPLLYSPFGVLIQTGTYFRDTASLVRNSSKAKIDGSVEIEAEIRTLSINQYFAGALSVGVADYVFISTGLLKDLNPEELEAVLAHEEGHLIHQDAFLSFVLPLVAVPLLTGKNILYTVMDFRSREFRADAYAVNKVGEDPLRRALQKMESKREEESTIVSGFGLTPTFISCSNKTPSSLLNTYFGTYFGNFALTEAHPDFNERINRLESLTE